MVDAINGSGKTIIITTKPKSKVGKTSSSFDDMINKTSGEEKISTQGGFSKPPLMRSNMDNNLRLLQQQQIARMNHIQEITRQIQDGTYKMCSPEALAEKILQVVSDKSTREKFIKKMLKEEADKIPAKSNPKMTPLEMKKLVFMIKESQDEPFDDPELEEMLKEFS